MRQKEKLQRRCGASKTLPDCQSNSIPRDPELRLHKPDRVRQCLLSSVTFAARGPAQERQTWRPCLYAAFAPSSMRVHLLLCSLDRVFLD
eukprot:1661606-Amphidinium_carterae.2